MCRKYSLYADLLFIMPYSFLTYIRAGIVIAAKCACAMRVKTAFVIIPYKPGTGIKYGHPYTFQVGIGAKGNQFFKQGMLRLKDAGIG